MKKKEKKESFLTFLMSFAGGAGVIIIGLILILLFLPPVFGIRSHDIVSPSMTPSIGKGAMVFLDYVDPIYLQKGDVIAFETRGVTIVHRVTENDQVRERVFTKGDANKFEDTDPVNYAQITGKVFLAVPLLGRIGEMLSQPIGKITAEAMLGASILLLYLAEVFRRKDAEDEDQ